MLSNGITYLDTFFARKEFCFDERVHFHELVHVLQWQILGAKSFLATYADGLERFGYGNSPLEVMAYELDERFPRERDPFNVEQSVRQQLAARRGAGARDPRRTSYRSTGVS